MQQVAQLAEQVREQRQPVAPDNPLPAVAGAWSRTASSPRWTAIATCATAAWRRSSWRSTARRCCRPWSGWAPPTSRRASGRGIEPERVAFVQQRIAELKARLAEGGAREAAIRALVYIGMGGAGRRRARVQRAAPDPRREPGRDAAGVQADAARAVLQPDARPRRGAGRHPEDAAARRGQPHAHARRRSAAWSTAAGAAERRTGAAAGADREAVRRRRRHRPRGASRRHARPPARHRRNARDEPRWRNASTRSTSA